ncbi:Zinc finger (C3HC4-type RING finger) family protein [Striga hermonthica]|uniref:Zinc finger (C3HC4-type RING finger) family protein n=1 Tax=Striga hermonthica TaxID=68872 RepID=A0A9N7N0S8_STRHE|nr:Zinc finger (C3HC4-type RING finger) family protein [Striga hermonthica]
MLGNLDPQPSGRSPSDLDFWRVVLVALLTTGELFSDGMHDPLHVTVIQGFGAPWDMREWLEIVAGPSRMTFIRWFNWSRALARHSNFPLSGGTFSFIESYETVQDAFAKCIGGLLSVVVRDLRLKLRSASHGVRINSIPSGSYTSEISGLHGTRGAITVGDLYADEEKDFLTDISVPAYAFSVEEDENENDRRTPLVDVTCYYKDVASNERVEMESAEIKRPGVVAPADIKVKLEVDRQMNRLHAAEGLAEAQRAAEKRNLEVARAILSSTRSTVTASASGQAGDGLALQLEAEMRETEEKMGCKRTYEQVGRAYALSSMSAHSNQRASTRRRAGSGTSGDAYATPNMANMVSKCHQVIKIEDVKEEED